MDATNGRWKKRLGNHPTSNVDAFNLHRMLGARFGRLNIGKNMSDAPIIDSHSDDHFMREALRQAARACEAGEVPVGAVVVREGRIIARAFNQVEQLKDATAHAEMLALTQAESAVGDWRLTDCTLYVTKEPCPMCAGAIVHTRVARVVFGAGDPKGGAAGGVMNLLQFPTLNHRCEITGGVREADCREILQQFFKQQRRKPDGRGGR
jgi:tRNA(adenine34) deaminase